MTARMISQKEWESQQKLVSDRISVQNIQQTAVVGSDIWGRRKAQPVHTSVAINLSQPLISASSSDSLDTSTVHYGQLSKNVAAALDKAPSPEFEDVATNITFAALNTAPDRSIISSVEVDMKLPKGSRYGENVGYVLRSTPAQDMLSGTLYLTGLRIPTIIGVNDHERSMKQQVIVSVRINRAKDHITDTFVELEQVIVKTVEESEFETLEALAEEIAVRSIKYFIYAKQHPDPAATNPAGIAVRVEKPSAVVTADAPVIEIYRGADLHDPYGRKMWTELGNKSSHVPFPLQGRLDEFLGSRKQD